MTDLIRSSNVWLWLVVTGIAALLLAGSAGRRRLSLVAVLKEFVTRNQGPPADRQAPTADGDDANSAS